MCIRDRFKGMELVVEPVEKVNVTLDGIILREEGRNISPTIYINDMYKKYQDCGDLEETLMAACDFMERAYEQAPVVDVDSIMRDANEKIVFQLINTCLLYTSKMTSWKDWNITIIRTIIIKSFTGSVRRTMTRDSRPCLLYTS